MKIVIIASVFMLCVSGCDMVETNSAPPNVALSPTTAPAKVETPLSPPVVQVLSAPEPLPPIQHDTPADREAVSKGARSFLKGLARGASAFGRALSTPSTPSSPTHLNCMSLHSGSLTTTNCNMN